MSISTEIGASIGEASNTRGSQAIEVKKPKECCLALEMLSFGEHYRAVSEATGLAVSTLSDLKLRHQGAIELRRLRAADESESIADTYREVLRRKADRLLEDDEALDKLNPKDAALTYGILTDKTGQARGEATSVVEHRKGVSLDDYKAAIAEARENMKLKRAEEAISV